MRLQLTIAALVAVAAPAHADGTLSARGVYYKERATRVMQPMLDGMFEVGARGMIDGHLLVDAITSASASAGAADAVAFTERRYEAGGGYTHQLDHGLKLGGEAKYSTESDYKSLYAGARGELELFQKNTTLGLGGGVSYDTISAGTGGGLAQPTIECEPGATESQTCNLTALALYASASQLITPQAVLGASIDIARLDGYQSNPYRTAIAGNELVPERHPTERTREAFALSARYFVTQTDTTLVGAYRYYRDTWKVHGHTPELRIIQQVGGSIDATFRYRYHTQDGAFFYKERYASADEMFVSDDVKLSTFTTHTMEAKLGILGEAFQLGGRWAGARFEGVLQYVVQYNRFGNAIIAHVALTVPIEY
ncbi:MAG TPA: DUF3570 domain-containing protein [Kofleriaceae bacterium]|nr:DUF3570 domain-containing protein [Kofleriaceae bacterium]